MKKILFLIMAVMMVIGCSKSSEDEIEIPSNPESPKEYLVSLGFYGEIIDISESPLTRVASNDLYGIQVYSMPINGSEYKPYAYGLFDDKTNMTMKLLDGYKYKFTSTMIVDGKLRTHNGYNGYGYPFTRGDGDTKMENKFIYSTRGSMDYMIYGWTILADIKSYFRPNLDRYFGEKDEYEPQNGGNVTINMKRVAFGVKVITDGLTSGKLKISINKAPDMYISYPDTECMDIFTFHNESRSDWTQDYYTETVPVSAFWEKEDGALIPLVAQDITFKRNKLTTITVKVKDSSVNSGVDISQDNTPMGDGGNITINSGNNTGTDINP